MHANNERNIHDENGKIRQGIGIRIAVTLRSSTRVFWELFQFDVFSSAKLVVFRSDCREYIKSIPSASIAI